jgi:LacI family transcriptional regulator
VSKPRYLKKAEQTPPVGCLNSQILPRPLCAATTCALGVLRGIAETGRVAGRDVGVIGGDNHPIGRYVQPALTTFSAETHRAGKRMAEMLLERLAGKSPQDLQEVWAPELIIRASDGPHRVQSPHHTASNPNPPKRPRALRA